MRKRGANRRPFVEKHGMSRTKIYKIWCSMIERCYTPTHHAYARYGARGITVCESWRLSFEQFYKDMGERPAGKSLDRINNNHGYSPDNCRWATQEQQQNNNSATHILHFNGESLSISQWARKLGISRNRIRSRIQRGMSIADALTIPKQSTWANRVKVFKTHCKWGHEFTKENTGRQKNGARRCLACHRNPVKPKDLE